GHHQHRLASKPVAEVTEQGAAERPRQEADRVAAERGQRARERIEGWEKGLIEDQRGRGCVNQEVIPLDDRPKAARKYDGVHFRPLQGRDRRGGGDGHCWFVPMWLGSFHRQVCKCYAGWFSAGELPPQIRRSAHESGCASSNRPAS